MDAKEMTKLCRSNSRGVFMQGNDVGYALAIKETDALRFEHENS